MANTVIDHTFIATWYRQSTIDYEQLYMRLYVAYNAWYRQVTGETSDRMAITSLKGRIVIWDDFLRGKTLQDLIPLMERMNDLRIPVLHDGRDWKGLIDFWYDIRCRLFHGNPVIESGAVRLAYESLYVFMSEIMNRMEAAFTEDDARRLEEVKETLALHPRAIERLRNVQRRLERKYIESPDLWNVDMTRV